MITIDRILVPTDFSDNASAAYYPARQLAKRYGVVVDFIHRGGMYALKHWLQVNAVSFQFAVKGRGVYS